MPYTKEERRERRKIVQKKYTDANKEKMKEQRKEYYQKNREEMKEKMKEYNQTPKGRKSLRIANWKKIGIICDYDHYYNIYLQRTNCYYCNKEFENSFDRCLDHDHEINDNYNVRGIICRGCNIRDVYKKKPEKLK